MAEDRPRPRPHARGAVAGARRAGIVTRCPGGGGSVPAVRSGVGGQNGPADLPPPRVGASRGPDRLPRTGADGPIRVSRRAGRGGRTVRGALRAALPWAVLFAATSGLQGAMGTVTSFVRDRLQERLRARIQERVIAKAQALPLSAFEESECYDQLQRIERGLDTRLFSTIAFL